MSNSNLTLFSTLSTSPCPNDAKKLLIHNASSMHLSSHANVDWASGRILMRVSGSVQCLFVVFKGSLTHKPAHPNDLEMTELVDFHMWATIKFLACDSRKF